MGRLRPWSTTAPTYDSKPLDPGTVAQYSYTDLEVTGYAVVTVGLDQVGTIQSMLENLMKLLRVNSARN